MKKDFLPRRHEDAKKNTRYPDVSRDPWFGRMARWTLALCLFFFTAFPALAADKESAFERVMKTNTLRCGYYVFPPMVYRDQTTNALSGFVVDVMDAIARRANLKIEWTEEVTFGNYIPSLQAGRIDAVCAPMFTEVSVARGAAFTTPILYAGLSPLVRADDERFKDDNLERLNQKDIVFLTQDSNAIDALTREAFPQAIISAMPASMDGPTILQELVNKKADAILLDRNAEIEYNRNNSTKLKLIAKDKPVKLQRFALVVARDEMVLKDFLDNALGELLNDGTTARILKKWEQEPDVFLLPAKAVEMK